MDGLSLSTTVPYQRAIACGSPAGVDRYLPAWKSRTCDDVICMMSENTGSKR